jgi:hypothetical protein
MSQGIDLPTLPEAPQNVHEDITPEEALHFLHTGGWGEDPALKLVLQDAEQAEQAEQTRQYVLSWTQSQILYQSPFTPRYWPGTQTEAASISFFTVATAVNGITPQVMAGLFYENPPFMIQERPGTTAQAARALQALLAYQLDDCDFRAELKLGISNCLLFGTSMFQWGWEKFTRERKIVKRKTPAVVIPSTVPGAPDTRISSGELEEEVIEEVIDRPTFEHIVDLREILVDPGLRVPDIRKGKYVIRRRYMTFDDLDKLRDREGYNLPPREELLNLFFPPEELPDPAQGELNGRNPMWEARAEPRWVPTTADPFQKPLEVLERWDNETYIVVLQKKLVIYNDKNVYGKIPFLSIGWWNIPGGFWSLGLGRTIGAEQRLQTGITNLLLDNASLNLNTPLVRVRGKSIPTQSIRICPGKIIEVDEQGDLEPLKRLPAIPEANELMGMSQSRADTVSGNNPITGGGQAGSSGHSNLARSSAGAQALAQGASSGISEFIDNLADQVIVPLLYEFQEMNRALLPESQLEYIMSEELKHSYAIEGNDLLEILNARVKFSILAGSKMQTRRNMAQGLPLLSQFLANPAITEQLSIEGKKIDVNEIVRMWFEASDWKNLNDVIVPMTPQDLQRQQQQSQGGQLQQKAQVTSQLQNQKFQQAQTLADQENTARAARDVLREAFKKSVEPETLAGEPNTTGIGFGGEA